MRQRGLVLGWIVVAALVCVATGCSSGAGAHSKFVDLRVIPAPNGYTADTTAGASGAVTVGEFEQQSGAGSAVKTGFVAGYRQDYVSSSTGEGIVVTILQFKSMGQATSYFRLTSPQALAPSAPARESFPQIPGAVRLDATKSYNGEYAHDVIAVKGKDYMSVTYLNALQGPAPEELIGWAKAEYLIL